VSGVRSFAIDERGQLVEDVGTIPDPIPATAHAVPD